MRGQRRQDVLACAVLVHITSNAERRKLPHFVSARDRAAENDDRQLAFVESPQASYEFDTRGVGQTKIKYDEVEPLEIGPDARQQLDGAPHRDGPVPGFFERRPESVAHERRIVGDDHRLGRARSRSHPRVYRKATGKALGRVAPFPALSL